MHQFGWLSERKGGTEKGGSLRKGREGVPILEETVSVCLYGVFIEIRSQKFCHFLHEVRILSNLKYRAARFFEKNPVVFRPKRSKKSKNEVSQDL